MKACVTDEVHEVWCQSERHAASFSLEIGSLNIFHGPLSEDVRSLVNTGFKSWVVEAKAAGALAETHWCKSRWLRLIKCIGEERIGCMVCREPFLEEEEVIDIVEYSMEIWAQKVWLHETGILTKIRSLSFADHGLKVLLMQLLDFLIRNRGKAAILTFRPFIKELLNPSDLKK